KTSGTRLHPEPESDSASRELSGVVAKMGLLAPGAVVSEELLQTELAKPPAPRVRPEGESAPEVEARLAGVSGEPVLDEGTQRFIAQSLTDVDLFASYGLTQKAIGLLE